MNSSMTGSLLFGILISTLPASVGADGARNQHFLSKHQRAVAAAPPNVIGRQLELPEPSYEDASIARTVQHANETVMNFVEHTVRFTSMEVMADYLRKDAGISWLASYSNLTSCASGVQCSTSWRTDPALGGQNVTVIDILRVLDVRNVTRCHLTSNEEEAYCHLPMPSMDIGWAYFALAVPSAGNHSSPLALALVCHAFDDSIIQQLSAEKAALAAKYPLGIYCHPMNGNSFLVTARTGNASTDLQVSGLASQQPIYTNLALEAPNW